MLRRMHLVAILLTLAACAAEIRPVRLDELPESLRDAAWLADLERSTAERLRDGEWDHVIHYVLQSKRFTALPPLEPAGSARIWKQSQRIPTDAARRMEAFLASPASGERHIAMRRMAESLIQLQREYRRVMDFLYRKEWESRTLEPSRRAGHVAALYQSRGHSTDTELWASYSTDTGLRILKGIDPKKKVRRVLLVGPGLDWAPRTGMRQDAPVQSYQPYLLADSLFRLGLASIDDLRIDCADVNPRVVDHIRNFAARKQRLQLHEAPGDPDWQAYYAHAGKAAGTRQGPDLIVHPHVAQLVRARKMNILTERVVDPAYDLAIATNVLLYFNDRELGLALANITHALATNGHLLHNDPRPAAESWGHQLLWPVIHTRTHALGGGTGLFDTLVLHAAGAKR
ncbi:MAG: hypothetical protein JNL98_34220 [Bryobacterales bacterium]|nr:hypothetical protein [Bryobacterales bacterium]